MCKELIDNIITAEWEMFTTVNNEGGKAPCQEDRDTFRVMRSSQFKTFPENVLTSYFTDLNYARKVGRNLMTEKYARMMEFTAPDRYDAIKAYLPDIAPAARYVQQLLTVFIKWHKEFCSKYPHLSAHGRPPSSAEDTSASTSFETYLRSELQTYSLHTLQLYHEFVLGMNTAHVNLVEQTIYNTVLQYGYRTLQEANDAQKAKRR